MNYKNMLIFLGIVSIFIISGCAQQTNKVIEEKKIQDCEIRDSMMVDGKSRANVCVDALGPRATETSCGARNGWSDGVIRIDYYCQNNRCIGEESYDSCERRGLKCQPLDYGGHMCLP